MYNTATIGYKTGGFTGRYFHPFSSHNPLCLPAKIAVFTLTWSLAFAVAWSLESTKVSVPWRPLALPHVGHQIFVDLAFLSSINARWNHVESYLWFSSVCSQFHLCAPTRLAFGLFASAREDLVNVVSKCKRRSCSRSIKIVNMNKRRSC